MQAIVAFHFVLPGGQVTYPKPHNKQEADIIYTLSTVPRSHRLLAGGPHPGWEEVSWVATLCLTANTFADFSLGHHLYCYSFLCFIF